MIPTYIKGLSRIAENFEVGLSILANAFIYWMSYLSSNILAAG